MKNFKEPRTSIRRHSPLFSVNIHVSFFDFEGFWRSFLLPLN
eukprot:UN01118